MAVRPAVVPTRRGSVFRISKEMRFCSGGLRPSGTFSPHAGALEIRSAAKVIDSRY